MDTFLRKETNNGYYKEIFEYSKIITDQLIRSNKNLVVVNCINRFF